MNVQLLEDLSNKSNLDEKAKYDLVSHLDLKIYQRIGWVYQDDRDFWEEFIKGVNGETWKDWRRECAHKAFVMPDSDVYYNSANIAIEPSEVILCVYDYPVEKDNCQIDWISLLRILNHEDLYEVFEI